MKKLITITTIILLAVCSVLANPHERYLQGYTMLPSEVNTENAETGMSLFKDRIVYSVIDGDGAVRVFSAALSDAELTDVREEQELTDLNFRGTFGFDEQSNKIYFSRFDRSFNAYMLYEATLQDGTWTQVRRLRIEGLTGQRVQGSALVNAGWLYRSPGFSGFYNPTLTEDGNRIYFSAEFEGGYGGRDIWFIDRLNNRNWSAPQNAGDGINTAGTEDFPFIVGNTMYFATTTDSYGGLDLAFSRMENGSWGEAERLCSVFNSSADDYNLIASDDFLFLISGRNEGNRDDIFLPRFIYVEQIIAMAEPQPMGVPEVYGRTFPWTLFLFDFDIYILSPAFDRELDELVIAMRHYMRDHNFVVHGHTDERGSHAHNDRLSYRRSATVVRLLVERGIPRDVMRIEAHGKRRHLIENAQTEEEHAQNRRVEVALEPK